MTTTFDLDKHIGKAGEELNRTVSWNEGVCVIHHATILSDATFHLAHETAGHLGRSRRILDWPGMGCVWGTALPLHKRLCIADNDDDNDEFNTTPCTDIVLIRCIFSALPGMQTLSSDENSVCLSVRLSNAWFMTKIKNDRSRFLYNTKNHLA